jgi:hypothetical protein
MSDPYGLGLTPEMFLGKPTLHVPLNLIVQNMSVEKNGTVIGVFQTSGGNPLLMDSLKTHQLIIADAFIRPQLVFHSDEFSGSGVASLLQHGFIATEKWELLFKR